MLDHGLKVEQVAVSELRTYYLNPRRGNVAVIAESLRVNGQYRALCANRGTHTGRPNEVLAGNHTLIAARDLGWGTVAVTFVDVDNDQAARIVAVDNRSADLGTYDAPALAALLGDLPSLEGTGYTADDLAALAADVPDLDELAEKFGEPAEDDLWPILRFKVPPPVRDDFYELTTNCDDPDDDSARFQYLIQRLRAVS
jgi:ParB-like chromosome segregation protein Spo0J